MISQEKLNKTEPGMVAVIGIPHDENSSFMKGAALAPEKIRSVMHNGASHLCAENGVDLSAEAGFIDLENMVLDGKTPATEVIESTISGLVEQGVYTISLGGDHSVTYPIVKAYAKQYGPMNIVQFDAHPDLYDVYDGNALSHACPFARIMEEQLAEHLIQVGIRTLNPHLREQVDKYAVEVIELKDWESSWIPNISGPVYLSIDLDVLDPAFAPGVSHHEPGGLTTRDIINFIQNLNTPVVGADIVELNPKRDINDMTAAVAVKLLKEIAGVMIRHNTLEL
ncbi:MAG: agmatinase [Desulfobacteraceae bacterium]|nr:agmatinase [Desulfobacteraceae bacterium]